MSTQYHLTILLHMATLLSILSLTGCMYPQGTRFYDARVEEEGVATQQYGSLINYWYDRDTAGDTIYTLKDVASYTVYAIPSYIAPTLAPIVAKTYGKTDKKPLPLILESTYSLAHHVEIGYTINSFDVKWQYLTSKHLSGAMFGFTGWSFFAFPDMSLGLRMIYGSTECEAGTIFTLHPQEHNKRTFGFTFGIMASRWSQLDFDNHNDHYLRYNIEVPLGITIPIKNTRLNAGFRGIILTHATYYGEDVIPGRIGHIFISMRTPIKGYVPKTSRTSTDQ